MGEIEAGDLDELAFGTESFEEHDEMELEENDRINRRPTARSVAISNEIAYKREIEGALELPIEVVWGNGRFQRDQHRTIKIARFGGTEHCTPPFDMDSRKMLLPSCCDFQQPGSYLRGKQPAPRVADRITPTHDRPLARAKTQGLHPKRQGDAGKNEGLP